LNGNGNFRFIIQFCIVVRSFQKIAFSFAKNVNTPIHAEEKKSNCTKKKRFCYGQYHSRNRRLR